MGDRQSFLDSIRVDNRDNHIEKAALANMANNSGKSSGNRNAGGREIADDFQGVRGTEAKPYASNANVLTMSTAPAATNTASAANSSGVQAASPGSSGSSVSGEEAAATQSAPDAAGITGSNSEASTANDAAPTGGEDNGSGPDNDSGGMDGGDDGMSM